MKYIFILIFLFSGQSFAQVSDGQSVNAAVTNGAFIFKNADDTALGKINLNNVSDPGNSGSEIFNVQRELNSISSFTGKPINQSITFTPVWINNDVGSSTDNIKTRTDLITQKFNGISGHAHTGAAGDGKKISSQSLIQFTPTTQIFSSGSGTYTLPTNPTPIYLRVVMVGGGGGGGGSGGGSTAGGNGGNSTFGTALLVANGGTGGTSGGSGGIGGTSSLGSAAGIAITGGSGSGGGGNANPGGSGGNSLFGGAGGGGFGVNNATHGAGLAASGNSGSGGGGGGAGATPSGAGGGAGGSINAIIISPSSTYPYSVGSFGAFGAAGTNGSNGGSGAQGYIVVYEYYQ